MRNSHTFGHGIDSHNHRGCAGWNRPWSSPVDHHHAAAHTRADDYLADSPCAEALAVQATVGANDEIEVRTSILGWRVRSGAESLPTGWSPTSAKKRVFRTEANTLSREAHLSHPALG
jgi:hypothetical protein